MGLYDEFRFKPAAWLPNSHMPLEELERIRNIRREDMEYVNENGFQVKVVLDPTLCMVQDVFYRILMSDLNDTHLTMIFPNQWPGAYGAIAEMLNKFNVSARNVDAFAMDEWADEEGNVAPLTYGAGLGYSATIFTGKSGRICGRMWSTGTCLPMRTRPRECTVR